MTPPNKSRICFPLKCSQLRIISLGTCGLFHYLTLKSYKLQKSIYLVQSLTKWYTSDHLFLFQNLSMTPHGHRIKFDLLSKQIKPHVIWTQFFKYLVYISFFHTPRPPSSPYSIGGFCAQGLCSIPTSTPLIFRMTATTPSQLQALLLLLKPRNAPAHRLP